MIKWALVTLSLVFVSQASAKPSINVFGKKIPITITKPTRSVQFQSPGFCEDLTGDYIGKCDGDNESVEMRIEQWNCKSILFGSQMMSIGSVDVNTEVIGGEVYATSQNLQWIDRNKLLLKQMGHLQVPLQGYNFIYPYSVDAEVVYSNGQLTIDAQSAAQRFRCVYLKK